MGNPIKAKTTNYQVLSTNYTDYTVIWNCAQEPLDIEIQYAWILTREQFPPQELIDGIYQLMSDNGLEPEHFSITKQTRGVNIIHCRLFVHATRTNNIQIEPDIVILY